jgi:hypothetical protein
MVKFKRLLNWLNPYSPKGVIYDTKHWIDTKNKTQATYPKDTNCSELGKNWYKQIESPQNRKVDLTKAKPVTQVDRFLKESYTINANREFPGQTLFALKNARIIGTTPDIISSDNQLFGDIAYPIEKTKRPDIFYRRRFPKVVQLEGTYLNLCFPDSKNYYHWLIESLPNVRCIEGLIQDFKGVFIPQGSTFQRSSLIELGFKSTQLIELSQQSHYECETLFQPSFNSGYTPFTWYSEWIKSKIISPHKKNLTQLIESSPSKLFITRKDGAGRQLTNESDVINLVRKYGFEEFNPSGHSFIEQAAIYNQADTIVSLHGAGLANMIFCQPSTKVLEIFPAFWTPLCYFQLANVLNLDYHFMVDLPLDTPSEILAKHKQNIEPDDSRFQGDIFVPLDKLERFLLSV